MARARDAVQMPAVSANGLVHLHIHNLPEAAELAALSGGLHGFNPAVSQKQQRMMAIAEHDPEKLYARNRSALAMTHEQLHDFAATKRSKLPTRAKGR